jgi:AhpD family alkylhydroperoxidase
VGHFSASVPFMSTSTETRRISLAKAARESYRALNALDESVDFDPALRDLINLRASQLNGCAFCVDMHSRDALSRGENERRVWAVAVWREAPFFDERERAALALTDAMTRLPEGGVPDEVYDEAARHFDEQELGQLMFSIIAINAWNRLGVTTRLALPDA